MAVTSRTQVGIVGAGPAGLLLSHLLTLAGIDSVLVENRSRAYCEARQRAGMLETGTVELLRAAGVGKRLDAEGIEHDGIYLQFAGERHNLNFRELTGGRTVTIYAQPEIVKDLIARRLADGGAVEFSASDVAVSGVTDGPADAVVHRRVGRGAPGVVRRDRRVRRLSRDLPAAHPRSSRSTSGPIRSPGWASWPTPPPPPTS